MYLNNVFTLSWTQTSLAESGSSIWHGLFLGLTLKCSQQTCVFEHPVARWRPYFRAVETGRWQWVTGVGFWGLWSTSASGQPQCQKQLPHAPATQPSPLWWATKVWALMTAWMSWFSQCEKNSTHPHCRFSPGLYPSLRHRENRRTMFWLKKERCKTSDYWNMWDKSWREPCNMRDSPYSLWSWQKQEFKFGPKFREKGILFSCFHPFPSWKYGCFFPSNFKANKVFLDILILKVRNDLV